MRPTTRELTKDRENSMLGGVCAGLGQYFDIDVTLVRALFIGLTTLGGFGPALYLALWILLDNEETIVPPCAVEGGLGDVDLIPEATVAADEVVDRDPEVPVDNETLDPVMKEPVSPA
jgi:phage shock protein PspC (stress-responsive transcriptional regulator)